ncbi:PAS domain-containing sensor histidine kinase [Solitalea lacus]|uniref:PAS domain-containing sensor histidine kinase n=1 Tax=Solitalea lacus TaxID=2911172 RepID=UPI001EDC79CC|nr:PAS domain S-box protein [Solitalea lacus]UKJ08710.1 PAS domain S-box protein [Solitalea lacus]
MKSIAAKEKNNQKAQQRIVESESRLRAFFENVEGFTCLLDNQKRLVIFNHKFAEGYKLITNVEPKVGEEFYAYLPPNERQWQEEILNRVLQGNKETTEGRYELNGRQVLLRASFNPVIVAGAVTGISVYITDFTKKFEAELAIREAEAKFRGLVETSIVGVYIIQDGKFRYVNPRFAEIFGYEQDELIDSYPVEVVVAEEDRKIVLNNISDRLKGEKVSIHYEARGRKKDGQIIHVEIFGSRTLCEGKPAIIGSLIDITVRKRAQEQIINEKKFSDSIINSLPGVFYMFDRNGKYLWWNKNLEIVSGYDANEIANHKAGELIAPEDRGMVNKTIEKVFAEGYADVEAQALTKNQFKIPYYFTGRLIEYDGKPYMLGLGIDMTTRKNAEVALKESERKYRALIEQAADAILLVDKKNNLIDVNSSACQLLGYAREELLWMKISDIYYAEELRGNPLQFDLLLEQKSFLSELKLKRKDGTEVPVEINSKLLDDGRFQSIIRDITERKKAEEALQKSEANLHAILDATYTGYILVDKAFKVISYNHSAVKFVKLERDKEIKVGDNLIDYFLKDRQVESAKLLNDVLQGKRINYESEYPQADGSIHCYEVQMFPISNQNNKIFGVVLGLTDITKRKKAELDRQHITDDLLQRNKDLEQFAYIVSHNLRGPVASMLGISEILHSPYVTKEEKDQLEQFLFSSVQKLDEIIKDLNQVVQVKRGITEKKERVYLASLVEDIKSTIQNLLQNGDIEIRTNFSQIGKLTTFRSYLYSIFYNLISNSIKFKKPHKKQLIEISSENYKDKIELKFRDEGVGIDLEKYSQQLFGLYNRFHLNTEGKGMGLFMVKTQVEILGGKIYVESEPNVGTTFLLEFPK